VNEPGVSRLNDTSPTGAFDFGQAPALTFEYRLPMKPRRLVAVLLIALGAVMLFAAPETLGGVLAIAAGVIIEIVGIALEKRR
jgi:drug/metabolite transporter (DMT)-like permease